MLETLPHLQFTTVQPLMLPLSRIRLDPENENYHPPEQIAALSAALDFFGQQFPIVIDQENVCIAGEGVFRAARSLKWKTIECLRSLLTGPERAAYRMADNNIPRLAMWDLEVMRANMIGIEQKLGKSFDPLVMGFTREDVRAILHPPQLEPRERGDRERTHAFLKIEGVRPRDKTRVLEIVSQALKGTEYEAKAY